MYAGVERLLKNALLMPRWGHEIQMYPAAFIMVIMNLSAIVKHLNGGITSKVAPLTSFLHRYHTRVSIGVKTGFFGDLHMQ